MLHHLRDKGPWFRAKRFGYGAGPALQMAGLGVAAFAHGHDCWPIASACGQADL